MERTFQMIDEWSRNFFESDEFRATKINGVFKYPAEYFNLYTKEMWSLPIDTTFEMQFRTVFFEVSVMTSSGKAARNSPVC